MNFRLTTILLFMAPSTILGNIQLECGEDIGADRLALRVSAMQSKTIFKMAIIYVGFQNSNPDHLTLRDEELLELPQRIEEHYARISNDQHLLECVVVDDPNNPGSFWIADHDAGVYAREEDASNLNPNYEEYWDVGQDGVSVGFYGALQGEVLKKIEAAYGCAGSPLDNAYATVFIYRLGYDSEGQDEWPQQMAGLGSLRIAKEVSCVTSSAQQDPGDVNDNGLSQLNGCSLIWFNPSVVNDVEFMLAHEYGHVLGLEHPPFSQLGVSDQPAPSSPHPL